MVVNIVISGDKISMVKDINITKYLRSKRL
jgi:hypothetical protein